MDEGNRRKMEDKQAGQEPALVAYSSRHSSMCCSS
jgi:hypothetical protein